MYIKWSNKIERPLGCNIIYQLLCIQLINKDTYSFSASILENRGKRNIRTMANFKDDRCFISFFAIENFVAKIDTYENHQMKRTRHTDRSLESLGNCCWILFSKSYFRGHITIIQKNESRKRFRRGLGRKKGKRFRSIKKFTQCEDIKEFKKLRKEKRQHIFEKRRHRK